jgi:hypothetical protein
MLMGFELGTLLALPHFQIGWHIFTLVVASFAAVAIMRLYAEGYYQEEKL